jgi:hypothetical protein
MTSERILAAGVVVLLAGAAVLADKPVFVSIWKTPDAYGARLVGKKVAAVVISDDDSLRVSGEEALVNELNARNIQGVASYRIAPKEELRDAARARPWFERQGIAGVVAVRPISSDVIKSYTPATWTSAYYQSYWGYYNYGWGAAYVPASSSRTHVVVVESLVFDVQKDALLWAAVTETHDPEHLQGFVADLVKETVTMMQKVGLAGGQPKEK